MPSVEPGSPGEVVRPVELVEVGPRDGLQNEVAVLATEVKLELIRRAVAAGLRRIEAVSFVHPRLVPQLADAEAVMAGVRHPDFLADVLPAPPPPADSLGPSDRTPVRYIGLVLNAKGLQRALDAGVDEVNVVVAASDTFSRRNQGAGLEQVLAATEQILSDARAAAMPASVVVSTAFGCPFEGEISPDAVLRVAQRCLAAGPVELAVADTIGVGVPAQVRALVAGITTLPGADGVRLRAHFHNTRNTGYANALAAVEAGVGVLDASLGGIGGCPFAPNATGNIATEDLVYLLHRSGCRTGVDLARAAATGTWVAALLSHDAPALLGRAGGFPVS